MGSIVSAIVVLALLGAALATLLVLAEKKLVKTGPVKLTINEETPVIVQGGENLLAALRDREIFIPSACGGRGSCGMCKLRVVQGAGPVLPTEEPHLTPEEKADAVRLSCQVKVRGDLTVAIPPEMLEVEEHEADVCAIERLNYDTVRITLRFNEGVRLPFTAGQYVQLQTPIYDGLAEPTYRAYSIASPPSRDGELELIIRKVPEGIATTFIHELLLAHDRIRVNGPYGDFSLQPTGAEAVFIAGGSGIAPFESILADMAEKKIRKKVTFFFGGVARRDLYDLEKVAAFEETLERFTFIPALSHPTEGDDWQGETGLVTEVVRRHYADREAGMAGMEAYLCGSPGMIDACVEVLTKGGVEEERIHYDKFA